MKKYLTALVMLNLVCFCKVTDLYARESPPAPPRVSIENRKIYVDTKEFFVKGVAYGLSYPKAAHYSEIPGEILEKDFKMMQDAGVNAIRTYRILPDFVLDLAEKHNIMVIENVVYPGDWTDFDSQAELEDLKSIAVENVRRHKNRKCILAWDIWNDAPFSFGRQGDVIRRYGKEKVERFFREIYSAIKSADPARPVTGSNLTYYEESVSLGGAFLDILSYNVYLGLYDWLDGKFNNEKAKAMAGKLKEVSAKYNKPVIVAETGYSTYLKSALQGDVIQDQIKAVRDELAGIIIFEWADEWDKAGDPYKQDNHIEEHWGIVDGYRNPKEGYYKLREVYKNP